MNQINYRIKVLLTIFGLLGSFLKESSAQKVIIKDVEEAFNLALKNNIDIQNFQLNQEHAAIEYKQAKNHRLPTINGTFSGQRNIDLAITPLPAEIFGGEPGTTINTQFGQEYTYNAGISISKDFFNQQNRIQAKMSKLNVDKVGLEQELFEEALYEQVVLYYYTGLIAQKAVVIGDKDFENASKIAQLTEEKHQQGLADKIATNNALINRNKVTQSLTSNKQLAIQCEVELKKLLGLSFTDSIQFEEEIEYSMPDPVFIQQLKPALTLRNNSLDEDQAELQLKLSRAYLMPTVSMSAYRGQQQFRDDLGLSFSGDNWSPYSYLTLNLNIPIFNGFSSRQEIKQSKLSQQITLNNSRQLEQQVTLDDQKLILDYNLSLRDTRISQETYELYQVNCELSLQKYEEGLLSLDSYLGVFSDYIKAENTYLNSMSKLYTYYSQIMSRVE